MYTTEHISRRCNLVTVTILLFATLSANGQSTPGWTILFPEPGPLFTDVSFTPSSKVLVLGNYGWHGCEFYDFSVSRFTKHNESGSGSVVSLSVSPDGSRVTLGCGGLYCYANVKMSEISTGSLIWDERYARNVSPHSPEMPVWSMAFTPDAKRLFIVARTMGTSTGGHLVGAQDGREISKFIMRGALHCEFFPDGRRVFALRHYDGVGRATIYDTETGEELWNVEGPETGGITGDGKRAVLHYPNEGVIRIFDLEKGGDPKVYDCADPIMQVLSDGKNVVTANGRQGGLKRLDFDTSKGRGTCAQLRAFNLPADDTPDYSEEDRKIRQARFSPDGTKLMFLTRPAVYVWDTSDLPSTIQETAKYKN